MPCSPKTVSMIDETDVPTSVLIVSMTSKPISTSPAMENGSNPGEARKDSIEGSSRLAVRLQAGEPRFDLALALEVGEFAQRLRVHVLGRCRNPGHARRRRLRAA